MLILSIPKMVISSKDGWSELEKVHPTVSSVLITLALPLSLLPPLMMYYVGPRYGNAFVEGYSNKPWGTIAIAFFLAEMCTLLFMGWFIKQVADVNRVFISAHDAYLLASIAPVPLWLSALALWVPSLTFCVGIAFIALGATCALIYHGTHAIGHMDDDVTASAITHTVMGAGLTAWALLLVLIFAI